MRFLSALLLLATLAPAQDSPKFKADVEQIVREYLLKHPEIIIEAVSKVYEERRPFEAHQ